MNNAPNVETIAEVLTRGMKQKIAAKFEELKSKFIADLDRDKDEIIAGITLHLMKRVNIQEMGQTLRIELTTEPLNK